MKNFEEFDIDLKTEKINNGGSQHVESWSKVVTWLSQQVATYISTKVVDKSVESCTKGCSDNCSNNTCSQCAGYCSSN